MTKTWDKLLRLRKWQMDELSRKLVALDSETSHLVHLQKAMNAYLEREIKLYDQALETHPIVPHFMRNISVRQRKVLHRLEEIETLKKEAQDALYESYVERKQIEILKEKQLKVEAHQEQLQEEADLNEKALQMYRWQRRKDKI